VVLVVVVLLLPAVLLPLVASLLRKHLLRRKRVFGILGMMLTSGLLTFFAEKEESDEDMGFGLFD
jgi:4-amino-4-deoxy-L-arabinose transferase-like glycosyltransferase